MDLLINSLLVWIQLHTEYDTRSLPHPQVIMMTPKELTSELYADAPALAPANGIDHRINALYAFETGESGTIFIKHPTLVEDSDRFASPLDNPKFREILLHELIHHVQWHTGEAQQWQCPKQGETEAYLLGAKYLEQHDTADPLYDRWFWANSYAIC
ncbi:hypothetical protein GCM10011338_07090 [Alteromonas lipolytica]|nr:hypothetical protein GCM10011338_07090 [Alteromonas lipolytica]